MENGDLWPWNISGQGTHLLSEDLPNTSDRVAGIFSHESDSRIANVCLSVRPSQKPLGLSKSSLSAIKPIS